MDRAVYDAVSSIYAHAVSEHQKGPIIVTLSDVWAVLNGINGKSRPNERQKEKIKRIMEKYNSIELTLDFTNEITARGRYIKDIIPDDSAIATGRYRGRLLQFDSVIFMSEKGNVVEGGFRLLSPPVIYEYSKIHHQVLELDIGLLDTSDTVSNTDDVIAFRSYLLRRIGLMKNGSLNNPFIDLNTIYTEAGVSLPSDRIERAKYGNEHSFQTAVARQAKTDLEKIKEILNSWIGKESQGEPGKFYRADGSAAWIKGYREVKKGRDTGALEILFFEDPAEKPQKPLRERG